MEDARREGKVVLEMQDKWPKFFARACALIKEVTPYKDEKGYCLKLIEKDSGDRRDLSFWKVFFRRTRVYLEIGRTVFEVECIPYEPSSNAVERPVSCDSALMKEQHALHSDVKSHVRLRCSALAHCMLLLRSNRGKKIARMYVHGDDREDVVFLTHEIRVNPLQELPRDDIAA